MSEIDKTLHYLYQVSGQMNVTTDFLIQVYIGSKDGGVCGMKVVLINSVPVFKPLTFFSLSFPLPQVTLTTTAAEVVEFVSTTRNLPPKNYCVHLVLGDAESGMELRE